MMKQITTLLLGVALLVGCKTTGYKIEGEISGLKEGQVYLKNLRKDMPYQVDSTLLVDGKFTFKGESVEPELYLIFVKKHQMPAILFLENGTITVKANIDSMQAAKVEGSALSDLFQQFNDSMPAIERTKAIRHEFQQAQMAQDNEKMQNLAGEMNSIMEKQKAYFRKFVYNNTDNAVGGYLASNMARSLDYEELKDLIAKFESNLGDHQYVTEMKELLVPLEKYNNALKATEEGSTAPDFSLTSNEGESVSLNSFRGKYVLIDFWASWCKPCRAENPNIVKLYNMFKNKGFEIISISLDRDESQWKEAIDTDGLIWTQVWDKDSKVAESYAVQSIPSTFLLDKEGKILATQLHSDELVKKLTELLN
ncbi:AhpC/TSA family protein [Marinilabiliaceae bacterium JC017]|nr:AhpC/TSA family protein [Marinilabiliaceae bacterium JC017]